MSSNIRLTIDLEALADNWRSLSEQVFPAECAAVVKADAYGLGMAPVARTLFKAGCRSFFVAYAEEGLDLRDQLQDADIYVLNGFPNGEEAEAFNARLIPIVNNLKELARLKTACRAGRFNAALNIDTGLHRLGLEEAETASLRDHRDLLDGVDVTLVMSHLAAPETPGHPLNKRQRERFCKAMEILPLTGVRTSLAASAGIYLGPSYCFDMVRPGAALYGINPTPHKPNPMRPVVKLESRILQIHEVKTGETVGYGADFLVEKPSRIATLSIGYADGVPRMLSNSGQVFVDGMKLPIVGRVSMDLLTIDVTVADPSVVRAGSLVELIGPNRTLDEVGAEAKTIGYEIITKLGSRASRVYEPLSAT